MNTFVLHLFHELERLDMLFLENWRCGDNQTFEIFGGFADSIVLSSSVLEFYDQKKIFMIFDSRIAYTNL
jgi:hypothetical protein